MRRLQCTRRRVPLDVADDYLLAWAQLRRSVESAGGHAWIFRGADNEDQFLEFIEWHDEQAEPLAQEAVREGRDTLDAFAPALGSDEWEEAG